VATSVNTGGNAFLGQEHGNAPRRESLQAELIDTPYQGSFFLIDLVAASVRLTDGFIA
jgi:hypothetical protein